MSNSMHISLYELGEGYNALLEVLELDGADNEAIKAALDAVGLEFDNMAEDLLKLRAEFLARYEAKQAEIARLDRGSAVDKRAADRITEYLKDVMVTSNRKRVDGFLFKFWVQKSGDTVAVTDEVEAFNQGFYVLPAFSIPLPKPDSVAIKAAAKTTDVSEFARVVPVFALHVK